MRRRNMNVRALSRASGVASGYIYELLAGKKGEQIGLHILRKLAHGLGVKTSYLIQRIDKISTETTHAKK